MNKKREKLKTNLKSNHRGITLIALVITIIIMLILVAVTAYVAINGGLFSTAKNAARDTETEKLKEEELSTGRVKIDGLWYDSMEEYVAGAEGKKPTYAEAQKDGDYLAENAEFKEGEYTAVIPKGFKISEEEGEGSIATGLVIKDENENEFVWIPVTGTLRQSYSYKSHYSEPKALTDKDSDSGEAYDSQETLDTYYGKKEDGTSYYNYLDFKYVEEYKEMVNSVNKNHGFYIGRYETTIDSNNKIGSKGNEKVLTANKIIPGSNKQYRWWGLYAEQKKANVAGNGKDVQTAMIYGVLWDKTMEFVDEQRGKGDTEHTYDITTSHNNWHGETNGKTSVMNSGQLNSKKDGDSGDVALNIWDLESNGTEWTQEASFEGGRVYRGGGFNFSALASNRSSTNPYRIYSNVCSRLALYIKN